jgi:hypothetical protein
LVDERGGEKRIEIAARRPAIRAAPVTAAAIAGFLDVTKVVHAIAHEARAALGVPNAN